MEIWDKGEYERALQLFMSLLSETFKHDAFYITSLMMVSELMGRHMLLCNTLKLKQEKGLKWQRNGMVKNKIRKKELLQTNTCSELVKKKNIVSM